MKLCNQRNIGCNINNATISIIADNSTSYSYIYNIIYNVE